MGQTVSPDTCDRTPDAAYMQRIDAYLHERIPEVGKTVQAEVCLYTETPDEDFIIDTHPDCPALLIAAGFSGHGFKFCSIVGRILSELALTGETAFDITPFRINRTFSLQNEIGQNMRKRRGLKYADMNSTIQHLECSSCGDIYPHTVPPQRLSFLRQTAVCTLRA